MKCLFAHTTPGGYLPGYVNVSGDPIAFGVAISVRSEGEQSASVRHLTHDQAVELALGLCAFLNIKEVP